MAGYTETAIRPPRTLTELEQKMLLEVTAERPSSFRDHVIFSVALGTALREHEILALDMGDVFDKNGKPRRRVALRVFKRCTKDQETQEVVLSDTLRAKLGKLRQWKRCRGEPLDPTAPVFVARTGDRLSSRMLRHAFHEWQERAGFERRLSFHTLRHTSVTTIFRNTKNIRIAQRFARHKSILTTAIYTHPSDEEIARAISELPC